MDYQRLYEDKNLENKIRNIVYSNNDYKRSIIENNQYEYHYFLSPKRHGLFQWYPFKKEGSLLEIGAGYGQLTSSFTQKVDRVVAVEDTESKCDIISRRAEDATVLLSDFNDLQIDEKFDYIILCNIFEYAKSFVESENPYVDYLNYLKKFLKDNGTILLALSNRLGLKYFAGFNEEHSNQLFEGISGFNNTGYAQTFSKAELSKIIEDSEFTSYKFFYPYPDHEFPEVIHTNKLINEIPFNGFVEFSPDRISFFDESTLNLTLSQDNLSQYFANSFLVEIRPTDTNYPTDNIDLIKVGTSRKEEFNIYTTIWSDGTVSKSPISPRANDHIKRMYEGSKYGIGKIKCLDAKMKGDSLYYPFLKQKTCEQLLIDAIIDNDKEKFLKLIKKYYDALLYNSFESNEYSNEEFLKVFKIKSDIPFHCHDKSFMDLNFGNMFLIDGEFIIIDYEWIFDFQIPVEFIFTYSFHYHFHSNEMIREFTNYEEIFEYLNINPENIPLFQEWTCNFIRYFLNRPPITRHKILSLEDIRTERDLKNNEISKLNKEIDNKNKEINEKNKEIEMLMTSNSWKITKPMRKIKSIYKR